MSYTITDLKEDLTGILHGTSLAKITNVDGLIYRAARKLLNEVDPIETMRTVELASPLFDRVFDYACPVDLKGDRIVDIKPQVNRMYSDRFFQTYNEAFDLSKLSLGTPAGEFTIEYNTAVKTIRIAKNLTTPLLLNAANTINQTGTWTTGGDATNLTIDNNNYVYAGGSLMFSLNGVGTSGYLETTNQPAIDLTRDENQGNLFDYSFFPQNSVITSVNLRWGSSPVDYWEKTVLVSQNNVVFQTGWNLINYPWVSASVTGIPDPTSITYLRYTVNYDGTPGDNFRLNNITSQLGSIYNIEYYSKYLFRDAVTGAFQERVTDDSNIINLDTDSYNLLLNLCAYFCAQQIQGADASFDAGFFEKEWLAEKQRYVAKIRSQVIQPQMTYYSMPVRRRTRARLSSQ